MIFFMRSFLNAAGVAARIRKDKEKDTEMLSNELLKDANYYAREDTGELIRSSNRSSKLKEGRLIWDTPYAKKMYYTGTPSKDVNSNASLMWADKAVKKNKKKYERMLKKGD